MSAALRPGASRAADPRVPPPLLHLSCGALTLQLAPALGGSIAAFRHGGTDILRSLPPTALEAGDSRLASCFPLVPFSNRIASGRFTWAGEARTLARTSADRAHAIHGNARHRAWRVAEAAECHAVLTLDHPAAGEGQAGPAGWPWPYQATQRFTLSADTLEVTIAVTNRAAEPFPVGLGFHPFFPRRDDTTLRFGADAVWLNGTDMLPACSRPVSHGWDFAAGRQVGPEAMDNCFVGWNGRANIAWSRLGLGIQLDAELPLRHLVVWIPQDQSIFAVEPVSHMTDAVNRLSATPGHGLVRLRPEATMTAAMTLTVRRNPR